MPDRPQFLGMDVWEIMAWSHERERPGRHQWRGPWTLVTPDRNVWARTYQPSRPLPWQPHEWRWWFGPRLDVPTNG